MFQWICAKRPVVHSIDFTAAGTAPELHRIPIWVEICNFGICFPNGWQHLKNHKSINQSKGKDNIYFDGFVFFMTFVMHANRECLGCWISTLSGSHLSMAVLGGLAYFIYDLWKQTEERLPGYLWDRANRS